MKYIFLSEKFYNEFPYNKYPEIMRKNERPYVMVNMVINGREYGLPLRSNIEHKYAFWTNKSEKCGIDYSKVVIIPDKSYIDQSRKPYIRDDEHKALIGKEYEIKKGFIRYMKDYEKAINNLDIKRNQKLVECSTFQYFHNELYLSSPTPEVIKSKITEIYSQEFPTIKYINENTAKLIDTMNKQHNKILTIKEIKQSYENIGKKLELDTNIVDIKNFRELQIIIDDLKQSQLIERQIQAHQKATEQQVAVTKDIISEIIE